MACLQSIKVVPSKFPFLIYISFSNGIGKKNRVSVKHPIDLDIPTKYFPFTKFVSQG